MATVLTYRFLEARPKSAYRQLFIKGTRIRAEIIFRAHVNPEEPRTPDQLAADYGLPLEAVREVHLPAQDSFGRRMGSAPFLNLRDNAALLGRRFGGLSPHPAAYSCWS